jgi:hypothetical protein
MTNADGLTTTALTHTPLCLSLLLAATTSQSFVPILPRAGYRHGWGFTDDHRLRIRCSFRFVYYTIYSLPNKSVAQIS